MGLPGSSAGKESTWHVGDPSSIPGLGRSPGKGKGYPLLYSRASLVAEQVKNRNVRDLGLISGLGRSPERVHGNPLQFSCLENPHGPRNLAGYSPWSHKYLYTTEQLSTHTHHTHQEDNHKSPKLVILLTD